MAESPPHRPAASASLSAYTALKTIAVLSQSLWEVPLARAAPQTRHRHECSGAPTGGRRHPHRPLLPTHPTLNFSLLPLKPQHTTPGYVYNDMLGLRHQPAPTAAVHGTRGGGGGGGGTAGSTPPAGHPVARCTYCGVSIYPITLRNTLAGPPPRCNHTWADAAAADPLRNMAHDGQTNHLCNPCAAAKLMGPTYRRD